MFLLLFLSTTVVLVLIVVLVACLKASVLDYHPSNHPFDPVVTEAQRPTSGSNGRNDARAPLRPSPGPAASSPGSSSSSSPASSLGSSASVARAAPAPSFASRSVPVPSDVRPSDAPVLDPPARDAASCVPRGYRGWSGENASRGRFLPTGSSYVPIDEMRRDHERALAHRTEHPPVNWERRRP